MLVKSEYSPSGFITIDDTRDRPELTEAQKAAAKGTLLNRAQLLKYMGKKRGGRDWTDAEFEAAQSCDFPAALKRHVGQGLELVWWSSTIDTWVAGQHADIDLRQHLVGKAK